MRGSISDKVYDMIRKLAPGTMVFSEDYFTFGPNSAVNMAFSRLAKEGVIHRLARGIYYTPKKDPELGAIRPSLEDMARAIAAKERITIRPTGAYALNSLGFSTQVPTKVVFLTNGQSRKIKAGKGTITFKGTTQKVMAVQSDLVFLGIQALQELGKEGITDEVINKLTNVLRSVGPEQLRNDAKLAPIWIRQILYSIANKLE
jgi:hypothetical protein